MRIFGLVAAAALAAAQVKHVFVLQLENRSFDHMLGWLKKNNTDIHGLTGSECNYVNPFNTSSPRICVSNAGANVDPDPGHSVSATAQQIYGRDWDFSSLPPAMSGFVANAINETGQWADGIMACQDPTNVPILSTLATEFALFDAFHASIPGPTYPNRLFVQSATSHGYGDNSVEQTLLGWPQTSLLRSLANANVSVRVYFEEVATAWLLADVRSAEMLSNFRWMGQLASDLAAGDAAQYTFIDPAYFSIPSLVNASDQHPSHDVLDGERLIKSVYEALRASPLWNASALIITYDEHGGFYDHVAPPTQGVPNPDGLPCNDCGIPFNFDRLGVRVPTVVVSPWVAKGRVVHSPPPSAQPTPSSAFELSSIPATMHRMFNTSAFLTARDAWAATMDFVWNDPAVPTPRTDCPTTLPPLPAAAQSPVFAGKRQGAAPLTHLQRDLLHLAYGVAGLASTPEEAEARTRLLGDQAATEEQAGRLIRRMIGGHLARHGVAAGRLLAQTADM